MKKKVTRIACMLIAMLAICVMLFMVAPDTGTFWYMAAHIAGYLLLAAGVLSTMKSRSVGSRMVKPYMLVYGICFLVMVSGMVVFKKEWMGRVPWYVLEFSLCLSIAADLVDIVLKAVQGRGLCDLLDDMKAGK